MINRRLFGWLLVAGWLIFATLETIMGLSVFDMWLLMIFPMIWFLIEINFNYFLTNQVERAIGLCNIAIVRMKLYRGLLSLKLAEEIKAREEQCQKKQKSKTKK